MDTPRDQVLFGAAYYHEYQPSPRLKTDLDLMVDAGFSVIRVGESVWTTWEPEDGRFDLDWLEPVLDGAHERGIRAILGTPTYAAPPWLARRYPEIAAETKTGVRMPWGGRQEIDYSHPAFRFYAERIIRKITARYADHPAVIGYQVDNEPGMLLFHNHGVFQRFVDELRQTYGDVETLNEAWGLVYWSHRLSTWADLWSPGRQLPAAVRPGLAEVPGEADHRVHRLAGRHRPRVRPARPVRHHLHRLRAADRRRRQPDPGARRHGRQPVLRDAGRPGRARPERPAAGLDNVRGVEPVRQRGPDVRLQAGAVPDHRDQRRCHRRTVGQLPGLRRAVAAGRLGVRGARRGDDRVLALAHQSLRHRDVLDRHPSP